MIEKLKNKEARLNAMAFSRFLAENNLDESLLVDFIDLLSDASKLEKLESDFSAVFMSVSPENRPLLQVIEKKLQSCRRLMEKCHKKLEELGVKPKKFIDGQAKAVAKRSEFAEKFGNLAARLPEGTSLAEISPYLKGFVQNESE